MFRQQNKAPTILSDHMPFMVEIIGFGFLISWNLMKQMKFCGKFFNNGFNCANESNEMYTTRLQHQAAQLNLAAKQYNWPGFICLQECPENANQYQAFTNAIDARYSIKKYDDEIRNFITFYDAHTYFLHSALSRKVSQIKLCEGLKGFIFPLVFQHNKSNEFILVVNVHANYEKDIIRDIRALHQHADSLGITNTIFLGDFNRDLVFKSDDYSKHDVSLRLENQYLLNDRLYVKAMRDSSFCSTFSRKNTREQQLETRDGVISTHPVKLDCLMQIGMTNTMLSYDNTKKISGMLEVMPENFLVKLQEWNQQDWLINAVVHA